MAGVGTGIGVADIGIIAGGIVARDMGFRQIQNSSTTVVNCYSSGNISHGGGGIVGGGCGYQQEKSSIMFTNCHHEGNIKGL